MTEIPLCPTDGPARPSDVICIQEQIVDTMGQDKGYSGPVSTDKGDICMELFIREFLIFLSAELITFILH